MLKPIRVLWMLLPSMSHYVPYNLSCLFYPLLLKLGRTMSMLLYDVTFKLHILLYYEKHYAFVVDTGAWTIH